MAKAIPHCGVVGGGRKGGGRKGGGGKGWREIS